MTDDQKTDLDGTSGVANDPLEDVRKVAEELQKVVIAQNETIKRLEAKMNDIDRKTTASSASVAKKEEPKVPEPDPQEVAYRAMLREMGIECKETE